MRLPPLTSLRAFEAACRLESFAAAAEELSVTPSAVSHQIKSLEDHLGVVLFRRAARAVIPTAAARQAYPGLRRGFDEMASAMDLVRPPKSGPLVVSVVPSFAMKWLIPRLDRGPADIQVQIVATRDYADLLAGEADLAVRFGMGNYPGLETVRLFEETIVPLAAPTLLEHGPPLAGPGDLGRVTLLHDDSMTFDPLAPDWRTWLAAAGAPEIDSAGGPRFTASENVLQAALAGAGVALGRWSLAADDIEAGRLVVPFGPSLTLTPAYYLVTAPGRSGRPEIQAFRDWLLAEVADFQARPDRPGT